MSLRCFAMAKQEGWTCVTNDERLRRECRNEQVPVLWGLEVIALAVEAGGMLRSEATRIAEAIHESNPRYVTRAVVDRFLRRLRRKKS